MIDSINLRISGARLRLPSELDFRSLSKEVNLRGTGQLQNKFTRQSDLNFKVSGADYLLSIDKTEKTKIKTILDQIKNEIQTNPNLKSLVDEEKFALAEKLKTAIKNKEEKEILEIKQNIEQLNNFDFRYQVLGHSEIPANSTVSDVLKQADDIFMAEEAAH